MHRLLLISPFRVSGFIKKIYITRKTISTNSSLPVRFGVSETIVQYRLALARLSPVLWTAYEAEETMPRDCPHNPIRPPRHPYRAEYKFCCLTNEATGYLVMRYLGILDT